MWAIDLHVSSWCLATTLELEKEREYMQKTHMVTAKGFKTQTRQACSSQILSKSTKKATNTETAILSKHPTSARSSGAMVQEQRVSWVAWSPALSFPQVHTLHSPFIGIEGKSTHNRLAGFWLRNGCSAIILFGNICRRWGQYWRILDGEEGSAKSRLCLQMECIHIQSFYGYSFCLHVGDTICNCIGSSYSPHFALLDIAIATTNRWKGVLLLFCLHCFCPTCYWVGEPLRDCDFYCYCYCYCFCFCYWVYSYCFASKAGNVLILFCPACYRVGEPLRDRVARLKIEITSSCEQQ